MKDIHEKSYDIVTFSIKSSTFWIRKCIELSQKKTVRYPVNLWAEIPLTDIHQPTINSNKLTPTNYQQSINNCEHLTQKQKSEK